MQRRQAAKGPNLLKIRQSKRSAQRGGLTSLDYEWHRAKLASWEQRMNEAHQCSTLPEGPPRELVHRFLVEWRLA
jgi:hypothetical protein